MTSPQPEPATQQTPALSQIAAALVAVQEALPKIGKDKTAKVPTKTGGEYSYDYADLTSISDAVLPRLAANGLSFTTWPTLLGGTFVLRYLLLHVSGERLEGAFPLGSIGASQQMGSAITYARRYCLCAVVGVAPDEDDDGRGAAAMAVQADPELVEARDAVRGAWAAQYGAFDGKLAAERFRAWSKGGDIATATAGRLRSFAGYLHALPQEDAGTDPADPPPPATTGEARKPTEPMRKRVMAELKERYADRQDQLTFLRSVLGREITSRSELTYDDAKELIDVFESEKTT